MYDYYKHNNQYENLSSHSSEYEIVHRVRAGILRLGHSTAAWLISQMAGLPSSCSLQTIHFLLCASLEKFIRKSRRKNLGYVPNKKKPNQYIVLICNQGKNTQISWGSIQN